MLRVKSYPPCAYITYLSVEQNEMPLVLVPHCPRWGGEVPGN